MENNQDSTIFDLNIDEDGKSQFAGIAQWANINAIVGFVALGISLLSTIMALGKVSSYGGSSASGSGIFGIIITLAISLLLNITLINAASNIKKGIELTDQGSFGLGLNKLATYFRILGILTIIVVVIMVLAILVISVAGVGRSF